MPLREYVVDPMWGLILRTLEVRPVDVLRRAGLPEELLKGKTRRLQAGDYFRFWEALEAETSAPDLALRLAEAVRREEFTPPLFAALCSPHLAAALERLRHYKTLVAPTRYRIDEEGARVLLTVEWPGGGEQPPASLVAAELVFVVALARKATRASVQPLRVTMTRPLEPTTAYRDFFGATVQRDQVDRLAFSKEDALLPFLSTREGIWSEFPPRLRRRLADLPVEASVAERVHAVLLEGLPGGQSTMDAVSRRLAMSKRTLQRRLNDADTTFQRVLQQTREELARYYLTATDLSVPEISFLIGFEETNSFYRAFNDWTGDTPEGLRRAQRA